MSSKVCLNNYTRTCNGDQLAIDLAKGVDTTYCTDGGVFKRSRLVTKSKIKTVTTVDFQYADGCIVVVHSAAYLQNTVDALREVYKLFGLSVDATKTKRLHHHIIVEGRGYRG